MKQAWPEFGFELFGPLPQTRLTVAIPFRATPERPDILTRLESALLDRDIPRDQVSFLLADDGSPAELQPEIVAACDRLSISYLSIASRHLPLSRARARNAAAMVSTSPYLMYFDVDLMTYDGFFRQLLQEMDVQKLDDNPRRFLMFAAIYLSERGSREYLEAPADLRRQTFLQRALIGSDSVEQVSTGTSIIVLNREHYLACGGMSEDFVGWGFEDHELICRLMFLARDFPEPSRPLSSYKNLATISEYRGWRAMYRLYGELTFRKGMALFHRWHPSPTTNHRQNEQLFHDRLSAFYRRGKQPAPLRDLASGRTPVMPRGGAPWVVTNFTNTGVFASYTRALGWFRKRKLLRQQRRHHVPPSA